MMVVNRYSDFTDRINGSFSFVDTDTRLDMAAKLRAV